MMKYPKDYKFPPGKFKPCPFCGCDNIEVLPQRGSGKLIRCWQCNVSKFVVTEYKRQLYAEWNTRVEDRI